MPTAKKKARYLQARTFCLGFPSYHEDVFAGVEHVLELAQTGVLPFRGATPAPGRRPSRNQVIKGLVALGLETYGVSVNMRQGFITKAKVGQGSGK